MGSTLVADLSTHPASEARKQGPWAELPITVRSTLVRIWRAYFPQVADVIFFEFRGSSRHVGKRYVAA
jgi:hypothetical protein